MKLNVVEFLKNNSIETLEQQLGIKAKRHNKYNNLVLFKYDQITSPTSHPIVRECRGIILDENNDWNVVSFPYIRFANYGENWADNIDWNTAKVYPKLDGSLMVLYYYNNEWQVASSGSPDASGNINALKMTFAELFWKVWKEKNYTLPIETNKCYMFELMTPYNRVVVRHKNNNLVLHGVRRLSDFVETNPIVEAHVNNWECVSVIPFSDQNYILEMLKKIDPMKGEGFVVCDDKYRRVKMKSPQYVAISHLKDGISSRKMLEVIRNNESSELLSYYPEYTDLYYQLKSKFEYLIGKIEDFWEATKTIEDKKTFALKVKDQKFSGILFALKNRKYNNVRGCVAEINIKSLEDMMEVNLD